MKIGIIIAVARELKSFLESEYQVEIVEQDYRTIYKTKVNNNEIIAIQSGMGLIDAASACQYLLTKYQCDILLNFGVTGALTKDLKVDDLFVVTKCLNHDYDTSPIDPVVVHQYDDRDEVFYHLDKDLINKAKKICPQLKDASVASGDSFIDKKEDKLRLSSYDCNICDMEIVALARVAEKNHARLLSIKCISDTFDGNGGDFNTNVTNSSKKAFDIIKKLLLEF